MWSLKYGTEFSMQCNKCKYVPVHRVFKLYFLFSLKLGLKLSVFISISVNISVLFLLKHHLIICFFHSFVNRKLSFFLFWCWGREENVEKIISWFLTLRGWQLCNVNKLSEMNVKTFRLNFRHWFHITNVLIILINLAL